MSWQAVVALIVGVIAGVIGVVAYVSKTIFEEWEV